MGEELVEVKMLIGGDWVEGETKGTVRNPACVDEVVGHFGIASVVSQTEAAVAAAERAFPSWAATPISRRAEIMVQVVHKTDEVAMGLAPLLTREQGKVLTEAMLDVGSPETFFTLCGQMAERWAEPQVVEDELGKLIIRKEPVGVVAIISPWNWPVALTAISLSQALIAGNCVVVKPSSFTPLTVTKWCEAVANLFPPGVLNVIHGPGSTVGRMLTRHPRVRQVSFRGSSDTGTEVMMDVAPTKKRIVLELGGNDPAIILPDVKVDEDLCRSLFYGVFLTSGQVCMAIKRIYAHESIFDQFVKVFTEVTNEAVVGNGLDERATLGPVNNALQFEKIKGLVAEAKSGGAKVVEVGKKLDPKGWERGYFHLPTIITGVDASYKIVAEEQFGPVIPIMPYHDIDEAIRLANDTRYGLCSSIWTSDEEKGFELAKRLEAGYTWVNQHGPLSLDLEAPFGGWKESGIGRSFGVVGFDGYIEYHTITNKGTRMS